MRDVGPDFWRNLREELAAGRQWVARSVVLAIPLIALGIVGFLAATTQGPITAFIIVMEMVSGHAMVLSLMACALLCSGVARLITRPMFVELAALLLPSRPAVAAAATASEGRSS